MKNLRYISMAAIATILLVSCSEKEPDIPTPKLTFTDSVESDFQSVVLSCTVSGNVTAERLIVEYSSDSSLSGAVKKSFEKKGDGFVLAINGLDIQTTYYYQYTVENKASSITDEKIRQFKTLDYVVPVVVTGDVTNVSGTKATIAGNVEFACGKEILEQGFFFGTDSKALGAKAASNNDFSLALEDLAYETTYYYQAYAKSEIGTGKGEIKEFKTNNAISFNPVSVEELNATSISVSGGIADNGGIDVEQQGFRYCEGSSGAVVFAESTGALTIADLKPSTTYSIWYYAKTFDGEFESDKVEFTTKDGVILITTSSPGNVNTTSATLKANISSDGGSTITERGFCYGKNETPTLSDSRIIVSGSTGEYQYVLSNLPQNTKYYVRAYAINAIGTYFGEAVSFVTLYDSVVFGTISCSNVTASSASFTGTISSNGGSAITKCGFCYSTSTLPTVNDNVAEVTGSTTSLVASVKGLKSGVTYHVRAFATNANSTFYSDEITFETTDGIIQFANPSVSSILAASSTVSSSIISAGGGVITERGFCYGKTKSPSISGTTVKSSGTTGDFSASLTGLDRNTVYYVRAYAINETGTYYSSEGSFTTMNGIASVTTLSVTNVKALSATLNGEIVSDGGSSITERGFCYSTSPNPTKSNNPVVISGTTGSISKDITGLIKDTQYYVRAFATNSYGTHYGNEMSFSTSAGNATFNNLTSTDITVSTIKVSTSISSDGDNPITKRGFCYSTKTAPTVTDQTISVSGTTGAMSGTITGLTNNTVYYIRAFATNETGTSYSSEISVSTLSGLADVETTAINSITAQSVEVSGNVLSANGGTITARGFCYGTSENPTIDDTKVSVSGTTGEMSKTITGLTVDTKYYIRAFATTSYGTTYGNSLTFTTEDGAIAFSAISSSDILASSAKVSVRINSTGGSLITERGFCYSTAESPTISDSKVPVSSSAASYSTTFSSLAQSTKYYVRAYAKNAIGTYYYSSQTSFTTQSGLASFGIVATSNITRTTVDLSCNILSNGGADITQLGFCYSTSSNPTTASQTITVTGTNDTMTGTITNLSPGTTYYVKAFAKTAFGTSYSDAVSVTTDSTVPVTSVSLNKNSLTLAKGGSETLIATVKPDDATDKTVTWESSNNTVAVVADGTVIAVNNGTAIITAKAGEMSATCSVTVIIPATSISLNKTSIELFEGDTETLIATIYPSDATETNISWVSSNPEIATVENGQVRANGKGTASITAKVGSISATCNVNVKKRIEAVDLGLSVKWCSVNVGASNPEESGNYYRWGDNQPYENTDYSNIYGTEWPSEKDVATLVLGIDWRIPTKDEIDELLSDNNTTKSLETVNGVTGIRFTSKHTQNSIFLPFAGRYQNGQLVAESTGYYWVANNKSTYSNEAFGFTCYNSSGNPYYSTAYFSIKHGLSIRPVYDTTE